MLGLVLMTRKRYEKERLEYAEAVIRQQTKSYEEEILMKQANLATLQGQINPHFLYNTLDCIRGEALKEGSSTIANIAFSLSLFFRYNISSKSSVVLLRSELESIEHYLTIQQYRFGDRFTVETVCEDKSLLHKASLPKLSLQPIVENAILHAFSGISKGGRITITVRQAGDDCLVSVEDNGCGMDAGALAELSERICSEHDSSSSSGGVGLWNVNRRIQLYFGKEYGLTVRSCRGVGTVVDLLFPISNRGG